MLSSERSCILSCTLITTSTTNKGKILLCVDVLVQPSHIALRQIFFLTLFMVQKTKSTRNISDVILFCLIIHNVNVDFSRRLFGMHSVQIMLHN